MPLSIGDKLGPYEILAPIGEGGMGEVWKARDTRLNRIVAIKQLNSKHTARFETEARAIALLNHANICQLYDIGPDYLVMECIEGKPLAGSLPVEEAVRLAIQIAYALEEAHGCGILHRDLKPGNILLTTKRSVKLLDFGLAKLLADEDPDATRTTDGMVLGTAAYMSPEQAQGKPADRRSDIFSFGSVLYEMLSGRRAFDRGSMLDTLNAVVREEPAPLESPLADIVKRCLAKQPEQRFQSVDELRTALEQIRTKPVKLAQPSIAVLPFANLSGDKENEYFSDGLAEEILNLLAKSPALKVIARTSSFFFRGKEQDIRKIGEALGVTTVLEGSVRRSGNRIRIIAQLINAQDGAHLWSERFDCELTDVFAIQDEIADTIAGALRVKLGAQAGAGRYTPRLDAYDAYLRARHCQWQLTKESMAQAQGFYELAIRLDAQFALAHAAYADYFLLASSLSMPPLEAATRVRAEAQRALELDSSLPEAHAMLGAVASLFDYDRAEARRQFQLAMTVEPIPPLVRDWYAVFVLVADGRVAEALEQTERAIEEDPLNPLFHCNRSTYLNATGRYGEAEAAFRRALECNANFFPAYWFTAGQYLLRGLPEQELAHAEKYYSLAPWHALAMGHLAGMRMQTGDTVGAGKLLRQIEAVPQYKQPLALVVYHILISDLEMAADWMERAIECRVPNVVANHLVPVFSALYASPRWPKLARMMNLP